MSCYFQHGSFLARMNEELLASPEGTLAGVPAGIDVNKPPKNLRDAKSSED